jgi:hypothetical protein
MNSRVQLENNHVLSDAWKFTPTESVQNTVQRRPKVGEAAQLF